MKKNLRKNGGFAGIDISISMIIILIFIPTVFGIVYNIGKINAGVKRKSTAVGIATNVIEIAKSENYEDISFSENSKLITDIKQKYAESSYTNTEKEEDGYNYSYYWIAGEQDEHYQIQVGIKNYYPEDSEENQDLIKIVKVRVFYPYGNKIKDVNIGISKQNTWEERNFKIEIK